MILTVKIPEKRVKQDTWQTELKARVLDYNRNYLQEQPKKPQYKRQDRLWRAFCSRQSWTQSHNYNLESTSHGPYSEYIPITSNQQVPNEIVECLPYMKHLSETNNNLYETELHTISLRIAAKRSLNQWSLICKEYAPGMELSKLILAYFKLLAEGTTYLTSLAKEIGCRQKPLLYTLMEMKKYFVSSSKSKLNPYIVSVEKGEQINLQNVTKTSKLLFCAICLTYDCSKHLVSELVLSHNFQYVRRHDEKLRQMVRNYEIINIFRQLAYIYSRKEISTEEKLCSTNCYKLLNHDSWTKLKKQRLRRTFAYGDVVLLQMGIQMHNFDPCTISRLFQKTAKGIKCDQIFYYLINDYSLYKRLSNKLFNTEILHLMNEKSTLEGTLATTKSIKSRHSKTSKVRNANHQVDKTAICYHYFLNGQSEDVTCIDCHCQKRGYCLPQCQCSEQCQIPLIGCHCKGRGRCVQKCPCHKAKRVCIPGVCQNCFEEEKVFCCFNNELTFSRPKLTRVGVSSIHQAGLGLFAAQFITKQSFVIKYLGEIVESTSLEKMRQDLAQNSMFYSFELTKDKTLDSRQFGNKARFINHSKHQKNLKVQLIRINEEDTLIFRALRDIKEGEELLFNYNGDGQLGNLKEKYPFIE